MDLEQTLGDAGCIVVGFVPSVARATAKIDNNRIDAALLDVTLGGEMVFPVADRLTANGIPFVFITGKPRSVPEHYGTHPIIAKPYSPPTVLEALAAVMREAA